MVWISTFALFDGFTDDDTFTYDFKRNYRVFVFASATGANPLSPTNKEHVIWPKLLEINIKERKQLYTDRVELYITYIPWDPKRRKFFIEVHFTLILCWTIEWKISSFTSTPVVLRSFVKCYIFFGIAFSGGEKWYALILWDLLSIPGNIDKI